MSSRIIRAAIVGVLLLGPIGRLFAGDPIDPQQFTQLHTLIKPKTSESKWEQIPWLVSLWESRQRAAEEGKPILLWEMDGHPLGCT